MELEQALLNLVANAADAMPAGGKLRVETAIRGEAAGHEAAVITVSDTGTGISADVLPYIFEPFFTTKDEGKGTVLGLASVYSAVSASGGVIDVRSEPGAGTSFMVALPLADASAQPAA